MDQRAPYAPLCDNGPVSKLSEAIRRAGRTAPAPLGFAARVAVGTPPSMLSIVRLSASEANKAEEAARKGADALIVDAADAGKVKDFAKKAPGTLLGVRPQNSSRDTIASLREAGADFVVLAAESALAEALLEEDVGFVLTAAGQAEDTRLRLLGDLGLDAVITPVQDGVLTIERLLDLRRVSVLSRTPLLVEVSADSEASRLHALRESGVAGVIVDGSTLGKLSRLKETIAALPPRGHKRQERGEAVLPSAASVAYTDHDNEDDD
jgi:NAD(P)H-dependent flavin oxidoreductase YrpB (nitropropane dioxygenase family)